MSADADPASPLHLNRALPAPTARVRMLVYLLCTFAALALNLCFGKETAFDSLHYHLYDGFSALHDRFNTDYFAAGAQSYFNPYAFVPFFLLIAAGVPALLVGSALAALHSIVLWCTFELAYLAAPDDEAGTRTLFAASATLLALLNPIFLQELGSSFSDISTAAAVLGGYWLLSQSLRRSCNWCTVSAGVLLGAATALKQTNALPAVLGALILVFAHGTVLKRLRNAISYYVGVTAGFLALSVYWSYRLFQMFGNPFFPLLNGLFKSPEFTTASLKHWRFVPGGWAEALRRPFAMLSIDDMVHVELAAPDIRYALLLLLIMLWIATRIRRRLAGTSPATTAPEGTAHRMLAGLSIVFAAGWILWLTGSGNSRYFMPMACVGGILVVALIFAIFRPTPRGRNGLLIALALAQIALLVQASAFRWNPTPWTGPWFDVAVPASLREKPALYLSLGIQSNSFIVPYLPPGSGFVNFAGIYMLGPEGSTADRVTRLITAALPNVRVLVSGDRIYPDSLRKDPREAEINQALRAFHLRLDMSDCASITIGGLRPQIQRPLETSLPGPGRAFFAERLVSHLATCRVVRGPGESVEERTARAAADRIFEHLEQACPHLFQPPHSQSEHQNEAWVRRYPQTDLTAWISGGQLKFVNNARGPHENVIGNVSDFTLGAPVLSCGRDGIEDFVRLKAFAAAASQSP